MTTLRLRVPAGTSLPAARLHLRRTFQTIDSCFARYAMVFAISAFSFRRLVMMLSRFATWLFVSLLLLDDRGIALRDLRVQILAPRAHAHHFVLAFAEILERAHRLFVLLHVAEVPPAVNVGLERLLHGRKDLLLFAGNAEV